MEIKVGQYWQVNNWCSDPEDFEYVKVVHQSSTSLFLVVYTYDLKEWERGGGIYNHLSDIWNEESFEGCRKLDKNEVIKLKLKDELYRPHMI